MVAGYFKLGYLYLSRTGTCVWFSWLLMVQFHQVWINKGSISQEKLLKALLKILAEVELKPLHRNSVCDQLKQVGKTKLKHI